MRVQNVSQGVLLARDLKEAKSISDKFLGLVNKNNPRTLMFKTRFGIHTFFLKNEIDVLILNNNLQVMVVKTLKPNRIFIYNPLYSLVIELPAKTIARTQTKIGDKIKFLQKKGDKIHVS